MSSNLLEIFWFRQIHSLERKPLLLAAFSNYLKNMTTPNSLELRESAKNT